jgi:hypothetical protein
MRGSPLVTHRSGAANHRGQTDHVPGPARRLLRERTRLIAVILLAIVALSASGVQSAAAATLQQTLNANWRGAYDILVTAKNSRVGTDGYLEPNSFASAHTMTLRDVAKIARIPGVQIAAPIGQVVLPQLADSILNINLPAKDVAAKLEPQGFLVTATYTTDDGLSKRVALKQSTDIVIDNTPVPALPAAKPCAINGVKVDIAKYPLVCIAQQVGTASLSRGNVFSKPVGSRAFGGGGVASDGSYQLQLGPTPQGSTIVTLVDPVEERALLGKEGGFLSPLEAIRPDSKTTADDLAAWAKSSASTYAHEYLQQRSNLVNNATPDATQTSSLQKQYELQENDFEKAHPKVFGTVKPTPSVAVPMLIAKTSPADLGVSVTIRSLGNAPATSSEQGLTYRLPAGKGSLVGTTTGNVSELLRPFSSGPSELPWPGTSLPRVPSAASNVTHDIVQPGSIKLPEYALKKHQGVTTGSLDATGYLSPNPIENQDTPNPYKLLSSGRGIGAESVYAPVSLIPDEHKSAVTAVPVGAFSANVVDSRQSSLSYVPLGAYQSIGSAAQTADGIRHLKASVSGLGLVSPRTTAVASISSAAAWGQTAPVDAVRVRVSGITQYSASAVNRVVGIASDIRKLGFTTTVVAGSSRSDITVAVAGYAFGTTNGTTQHVGSLGSVIQPWSELGAAARADVAVSNASLAMLGISLGSTGLLLAIAQLIGLPRRRAQAVVMREIGWTGSGIRRWMIEEEIPSIAVVLLAGVAAVVLSHGSQLSELVASIGLAAVLAISFTTVRAATARPATPKRSSSPQIARRRLIVRNKTITRFGIRQVGSHPFSTVTVALSNAVVALSAIGLVYTFLQGRQAGGGSLISQFVQSQAVIPEVVLGATGIFAGIVLSTLVRQTDFAQRSPEGEVLRAMGWTSTELRSAYRIESAVVAGVALILTLIACTGGAVALNLLPIAPYIILGACLSLLISLATMFRQRKASRR